MDGKLCNEYYFLGLSFNNQHKNSLKSVAFFSQYYLSLLNLRLTDTDDKI